MLYALLTVFSVVYSQQSCKVSGGDACLTATSCPNDQICNQVTLECVNGASLCGIDGSCELCGVNGVITAACGSAASPACGSGAENSELLGCGASETTWSAKCDFASLVPRNGWNMTDFYIGQPGDFLSCEDVDGSLLIGMCGSTDVPRCYSYSASAYGSHGIQCASVENFVMEWDAQVWINGSYADVVQCPPGFLATGRCDSGASAACDPDNNVFHSLQCTPFSYPNRRIRRRRRN